MKDQTHVKKHYHLYVLLLEQHKFYIGITSKTPEERFREHKNGFLAARWTKKYAPIKIIDTKDLGMMTLAEAESFENKVVRAYMQEKGYNNARGGDATSEDDYVKRFGWLIELREYDALALMILLAAICILSIVLRVLS